MGYESFMVYDVLLQQQRSRALKNGLFRHHQKPVFEACQGESSQPIVADFSSFAVSEARHQMHYHHYYSCTYTGGFWAQLLILCSNSFVSIVLFSCCAYHHLEHDKNKISIIDPKSCNKNMFISERSDLMLLMTEK